MPELSWGDRVYHVMAHPPLSRLELSLVGNSLSSTSGKSMLGGGGGHCGEDEKMAPIWEKRGYVMLAIGGCTRK